MNIEAVLYIENGDGNILLITKEVKPPVFVLFWYWITLKMKI
jgi:hypothetical protein